jgi:hypothetical protein
MIFRRAQLCMSMGSGFTLHRSSPLLGRELLRSQLRQTADARDRSRSDEPVATGRLFRLSFRASSARKCITGAKAMLNSTGHCGAFRLFRRRFSSRHFARRTILKGTNVVMPCYNSGLIRGSRMCPCQTRPAKTPLSWNSVHSRRYRCRELLQQPDRTHLQWQQQENHSPLPCLRIGAGRGQQSFSSRPRQFYRAESYTWRQPQPNLSVSAGIPWSARRLLPRPRSRLPLIPCESNS